jgi:two-component system, chemotaxis family, sensor kinase CheA
VRNDHFSPLAPGRDVLLPALRGAYHGRGTRAKVLGLPVCAVELELNQPDPIFVDEALANLDAMAQALSAVLTAGADSEQINAVFRHAHSIKGGAAAFGLGQVSELMHHAESLLDPWRLGRRQPDADGVALLLAAVDLAKAGLTGVLQDSSAIASLAARLRTAAGETEPAQMARHLRIRIVGNPGADLDAAVRGLFRDIAGLGAVLSATGDGRSAGVFEVQTSASDAELMDLLAMVADQASIAIQDLADPAKALSPALSGVACAPAPRAHPQATTDPDRRVAELPGRAQNKGGGPHTAKPDAGGPAPPQTALSGQMPLDPDFVDGTPVAELFALAPAVLTSLAPALGKTFRLTVSGESLRLNRRMIQSLADPLIHLVRNACDHGIESAQDRRAAGKPAEGLITLSAELSGREAFVSVCDDGRGLSRSLLLKAARARGIEVAADTPDQALWPLVFAPGLTTAAKLTQVSGRGIGMDVVWRKVAALGGSVDIDSTPGAGTCVKIRLPVS